MKKNMKIMLSVAVIAFGLLVMANSCKKGGIGYTCSDPEEICGEEFQACCTAVDCYYLMGTKKYPCNGTNCEDAAEQLVNDACGYGVDLEELMVNNSKEELLEVVQMLLETNEECIE
ncbi:MAG TPA: hypothetical protein PLK12_01450 [Prolixibacteraceae bacterium]|nr:hypothetical protein [Prolixibacteraceae bacterium]